MIMEAGRGVTGWKVRAPRGLSPSGPVSAEGDMRPRDSATRFE